MMFWQKRKVLLTGHTGFKGSWLSLWLQLLGADLLGFSLQPPTTPNLFDLINVADGMTSIIGDIRDFTLVQKTCNEFQPEIIIHMAAQPLVRLSYQKPMETYATNVMGTVHILEAARHVASVKAIVNVTTDKCYENKDNHWAYCAYRSSYFNEGGQIGLASARAGNVIGGGDWAKDRLIPDIIRACMKKQPVLIRHPHALRPWQHVLEPLDGYLLLAERLYKCSSQYADSWNFGPNENDVKPVSWMADYLTQNWDKDASWIVDNDQHPHEAIHLTLNCSKAKKILAWLPRWGLEKGLQETMQWYKAYQSSHDMRAVSITQIRNFIDGAPHINIF
jgi:CDP-glucose 4,6-dehydratase